MSGKKCEVYPSPFDVRLPEANESDEEIITVVQPDLSIICDEKKLDDRGCRGAPDIVVEILSPFTAAKDRTIKFDLYQKHGVKEYWIVHATEQYLEIFLLNDVHEYDKPNVFIKGNKLTTSILEGLNIEVNEIFE